MASNNKQVPLIRKQGITEIHKDGYLIEVSCNSSIDFLKKTWSELAKKSSVPYFLTWQWISCWIKTYVPHIITVTASFNNRIVAIGLFTFSLENRHKIIHSNQLRLHQMGDNLMDQIWIEYNDFLCDEDHRTESVNACINALLDRYLLWDEVVISMMTISRAKNIKDSLPLTYLDNYCPSYLVDLSRIREKKQEYLQSLTANTRYQIRRSIRLYEKEYGKLRLQQAKNTDEALKFFHEAGKYHVLKWSDSGYKNIQFIQFHQNLIRDFFDDNSINLLKLTANKETIAIMYYHLVKGNVFFYLHGLKYEDNNKLKPGLVAHALATEFYLQNGMKLYDYMGGYSQYKEQLAQRTDEMVTVTIQRPRSRFKLEKLARNIKNRIIPTAN